MKKKLLPILYMAAALACLSGCEGTLAADRHDVERLLLVQTLGLDARGGGVEMSVSTGLDQEGESALVMSTAAAGIEDAIARLQNYSPENQLFYAHVQYLLLGRGAAERDLPAVLEWVDRSPTLRMDTDMLIVKGRAKDAVAGASRQATDITERLAALGRQSHSTGWTMHTLRQIAAALAEGHGALCLAVETVDAEDTVLTQDKNADAVIPAGYAVLDQSGLRTFLSLEQSLGAEIMTGDPTGILVSVKGSVMEILEGSAKAAGRWAEDGTLAGIDVTCRLQTGILERAEDRGDTPEALDAALSQAAAEWVGGALEQAQTLRCDFLGLNKQVLKTGPERAAAGEEWSKLLSQLPVSVTVEGVVDRSYDLAE